MPRANLFLILLALTLFGLAGKVTLRDRIMVETLHQIERKALVDPPAKLLFEGALAGMTYKLNTELEDGYSTYIPPVEESEYEDGLENRFDGIGIVYRLTPETEEAVILYPVIGSPAHKAGIRSGDRILSVNGKATKGMTFGEISALFRGPSAEKVTLSLLRYGVSSWAKPETLSLGREKIFRASVEGERLDKNGKKIFSLPSDPQIAYLRITTFSDRTAAEVRAALEQIARDGAEALVLDLRDNAGGYVASSVEIAGFFLDKHSLKLGSERNVEHDVIVSTRRRDGSTKHAYHADEGSQICRIPMAVLIDGETASAAEILTAALQDYGRATIVGTRSFGKGIVQEVFPLPLNSGMIQLTDASYWRPSNKNIHRTYDAKDEDTWGVMPDAEGLLPTTDDQTYATLQVREHRSNCLSEQADRLLDEYVRQIPHEVRSLHEGRNSYRIPEADTEDAAKKEEEPFTLRGKAPCYDPQLDRAVELLLGK